MNIWLGEIAAEFSVQLQFSNHITRERENCLKKSTAKGTERGEGRRGKMCLQQLFQLSANLMRLYETVMKDVCMPMFPAESK